VIIIDGHLVGLRFLETLAAGLELVLEDICHGHELDVLAGVHRVHGRPGAAPAAADQADLERIAARSVGASGQGQSGDRRRPDQGARTGQELASRSLSARGSVG